MSPTVRYFALEEEPEDLSIRLGSKPVISSCFHLPTYKSRLFPFMFDNMFMHTLRRPARTTRCDGGCLLSGEIFREHKFAYALLLLASSSFFIILIVCAHVGGWGRNPWQCQTYLKIASTRAFRLTTEEVSSLRGWIEFILFRMQIGCYFYLFISFGLEKKQTLLLSVHV